jgi:Fibrinogen beta and gamma chains, C-terminal globular domain
MLVLSAASCNSILGIDEGHSKPDGGMSGSSGTGGASPTVGSTAGSGTGGRDGDDKPVAEGTTCASILAMTNGQPESRVYVLDPDGDGEEAPFKAYCEMVEDGGGWTLAREQWG